MARRARDSSWEPRASPSEGELAALRHARDVIVGHATSSQLEHALSAVARPELRRDLERFARRLRRRDDGPWFDARVVWNLAEMEAPPWLPFARSLDMWRCRELDALMAWFTSLEALRDLRRLRLDECDLSDAAIAVLGASGAFPRLHTLTLNHNFSPWRRCSGATLSRLFAPRWMGALRSLDLSGNSLSRDAFEALSRCHSLRHLRSLRLALTSLGADAMRALTRRASWPDLTSLELGDSERASESLPVLFESRLVERLTHLSLSASRLDASHLEPLVSALPRMRTLVGLDLSENPIGDVGAEALAAATMPPTLRRLSLHACALSSLGFERIAAAPWAEGLEAPFA